MVADSRAGGELVGKERPMMNTPSAQRFGEGRRREGRWPASICDGGEMDIRPRRADGELHKEVVGKSEAVVFLF